MTRNVPCFLHLKPATGSLGLRLWLWIAFWHMRLSGKQNLNLALKEAFHLFTLSIPQLLVSPVLGLYFQCLSLSLAFPLSIYCYILAESAAGRTQGDSITQRPRSRELGGTCGSSFCTDPFLYINHCADLLPTGACMSI